MAIEVIMPKVDMDQETGTVVEWTKNNGEHVNAGDVILVIETDKVAVDVESPGTGTLDGISAKPGEVVPIGTIVAYILAEGEKLPTGPKPVPEVAQSASASSAEKASSQPATPVAKNMAVAHGRDMNTILPSGKGRKITKADVEAKLASEGSAGGDGKVYASPSARRVARENQVDLTSLQGADQKVPSRQMM